MSHQDIEQMRREIISVADSIRECQEELKDLKEAMYRQASQKQAPSNLEEEIVSLKEEISQRETLRTKV